MKFHKQAFKTDVAAGVHGDCMRTVLACMLDLERDEVPHFMHDFPNGAECERRRSEFLASRGLAIWAFAFGEGCTPEQALVVTKGVNANLPCMFSGMSRNGTNHVVIAQNGEIIHDTALDNSGIVGPMDVGYYEVEVLVLLPR